MATPTAEPGEPHAVPAAVGAAFAHQAPHKRRGTLGALVGSGFDPVGDRLRVLESIAEHASDAVMVWKRVHGDDFRLVYVNQTFCTITGWSPAEVLGRGPGLLAGPRSTDGLWARYRKELLKGGEYAEPAVLHRRDGEPFWAVLTYVLIRDDDNGIWGAVGLCRDVTQAHHEERRFRSLLENIHDLVAVIDEGGLLRYVSPSVERITDLSPTELIGLPLLAILDPSDRPETDEFLRTVLGEPGAHGPTVVNIIGPNGEPRPIEVLLVNRLDDPAVAGVVVTARDVTDWLDAEELLSTEAALLEQIACGVEVSEVLTGVSQLVERHLRGTASSIGVLEGDGVIRHRGAPTLAGAVVEFLDQTAPDSALGRSLRRPSVRTVIWDDIEHDPAWASGREIMAAAGLRSCWALTVEDPGSFELLGILVVFAPEPRQPLPNELALLERSRDLAAIALHHARAEARLHHLALHDPLTGLPNRTLLLDRIELALLRSRRRKTDIAVLFVDLDQFKIINDSLGHAAGDRLLEQVAERISGAVRADDTVGRFGGDEFVVLCEEVHGEAGAVEVAERLAVALRTPFALDDAEVVVTASVGIAFAGDYHRLPGTLIRDADAAMYQAKARGRNRYALADEELHGRMVRRLEAERALRAAITADELDVHYQARIRLADGAVTGAEALVRWAQPDGTVLPAADLIPVAEETGLIIPLGARVLEVACRQVVEWDRTLGCALDIYVNLSARQLADPALVELVSGVLDGAGLAPARLCVEITEGVLAGEADATAGVLSRLKELGVRLAIDDFGTGYATLEYVRRFAMADELKIDRCFVAGLSEFDSPDAAIVSAAIVLADALGFETVAEGVETEDQLTVLRRLGCKHAQGHLFSPPQPAAGFAAFVADNARRTQSSGS
jgi:diguanylate cyclase (GGDEF)-like protein/PAS domain S-box-containing protein